MFADKVQFIWATDGRMYCFTQDLIGLIVDEQEYEIIPWTEKQAKEYHKKNMIRAFGPNWKKIIKNSENTPAYT